MHGFIYFKDDFRSLGEEPGEANIQSATASIPDIFAIGPLTTGELWNGARSGMDLDQNGRQTSVKPLILIVFLNIH